MAPRVSREQREATLARLRHLRETGALSSHHVRLSAAGLPVPEHLVTGWTGVAPVALRTLQAAFARELTPGERAAWRCGERARRAAGVYLRRPATRRNEVWETDHTQLPVLVLPPRGPAVKPWVTTVVDDGTCALVGWALAITPHSGTVLTALRMALLHDPARGPFGGVPALVRMDRGLDFAAEAVRDVLGALAVASHRLPGYTPHRKGKVERLNRTIEQTLLVGVPGYTDGPRDAAGRLYGPIGDRAAERLAASETGAGAGGGGVGPWRIEQFAAHFAAWVAWYNTERAHAGLDGRTPLQAWTEDPAPVTRIEAERLRHLLLAGVERTIGKDGVRFHGLAYIAPELHGRRGQQVQVRYMPHDDRFIEVYLDGRHLCTAYPQGQLSEEQTAAFREHAAEQARQLAGERRRAARQARAALVPLSGGQTDPIPARLVPAAAAARVTRSGLDAQLRRRSRTDLLGLTDPTAPAPVELDQSEATDTATGTPALTAEDTDRSESTESGAEHRGEPR